MKVSSVLVLCFIGYCIAQTCPSGEVKCRNGCVNTEDTGCYSSTNGECNSCYSGYVYLSDTKVCQPCSYYGCGTCSITSTSNNEDKVVCDTCPDATYKLNDAGKCIVDDDKCYSRTSFSTTSHCDICVEGYYLNTNKCAAITSCADCGKRATCTTSQCLMDCAEKSGGACETIAIPYTIADYPITFGCSRNVIANPIATQYVGVKDTQCAYFTQMSECTDQACCNFFKGYWDSNTCTACPSTVTDMTSSTCQQCEGNIWIAKTVGGTDYQCEKLNCATQKERLTQFQCIEALCPGYYWQTRGSTSTCVNACTAADAINEAECINAVCNGVWLKSDACVSACPSDVATIGDMTSCNKCKNHWIISTGTCETPASYKTNCTEVGTSNTCVKCSTGSYLSRKNGDDCHFDVNADTQCQTIRETGFFCDTCKNTTAVKYTENCPNCAVVNSAPSVSHFYKLVAVMAVLALTLF